jgi:sec-independent protein translocase protein TatC
VYIPRRSLYLRTVIFTVFLPLMLFGKRTTAVYDDDFFADTRMSFGEHIEDLRSHLVRALKWFALGLILGFVCAKPMVNYITKPVEVAIKQYYDERRETVGKGGEQTDHRLNKPVPLKFDVKPSDLSKLVMKVMPEAKLPPVVDDSQTVELELILKNPAKLVYEEIPIMKEMDRKGSLTALSATEAFVVWMLVALVLGLVISSPLVLYELWSFVASGLYPHEKKYVYYLLPMSIGLFLGGVLVCQFFVMPAALQALFSFNAWLEIDPDLRLREWLGFAIMMPVFTGICFQTPLVMMFLGKIGLFTSADFLAKWRGAVFILMIVAAIFSPSIDAVSLFILWVPMCALYFFGIFLVKVVEGQREEEPAEQVDEVPFDPDMMK